MRARRNSEVQHLSLAWVFCIGRLLIYLHWNISCHGRISSLSKQKLLWRTSNERSLMQPDFFTSARRGLFFSFLFFTAKVAPSEKITPAAPRCHSCEGVIRLWILSKVLKHFDKRHHKMVRSSSCPSPRPCILPRGRFSSVFNSPGVWEERTGRWKLERNMARK